MPTVDMTHQHGRFAKKIERGADDGRGTPGRFLGSGIGAAEEKWQALCMRSVGDNSPKRHIWYSSRQLLYRIPMLALIACFGAGAELRRADFGCGAEPPSRRPTGQLCAWLWRKLVGKRVLLVPSSCIENLERRDERS